MKAMVKRCTLLEELYKRDGEDYLSKFQRIMQRYVDILSMLSKDELSLLNNNEIYALFNQFYKISLDQNDYLYAFSRFNGKNYTSFSQIDTDMVLIEKSQGGFGNGVIWSEKKQSIKYLVMASNNIQIDPNKKYTKAEIKRMLDSQDIIIVDVIMNEISRLPYEYESYEELPMLGDDNNLNEFMISNISLFGSMLRDKISPDIIKRDIAIFMRDMDYQLDTITIYNQGIYKDINEECKKWWINSSLKNEYDMIHEKVNRNTNKK